MKHLFLIIISISIFSGCMGTPEKTTPKTKKASMASKAFDELDCESNGELSLSNVCTPEVQDNTGDRYSITHNEANKAFRELEGTQKAKSIPMKEKQKPEQIQEKPLENKSAGAQIAEKPLDKSTKYPIVDGKPIWFKNPDYDNNIGGVGVAKKQRGGYNQQKRVAVGLARADLARNINVLVNTEISSERIVNVTKNTQQETNNILSRHTADEMLSKSFIKDEWEDASTGELYVWVVVP